MGVASCSGNRKILWVTIPKIYKTGTTNPALRSMFCFFALSGHMAMFLPWAIIHRLKWGYVQRRTKNPWDQRHIAIPSALLGFGNVLHLVKCRSRWLVLSVERSCCMLLLWINLLVWLVPSHLTGQMALIKRIWSNTSSHVGVDNIQHVIFSMFTQPPSRKCHGCSPKLTGVSLSNR